MACRVLRFFVLAVLAVAAQADTLLERGLALLADRKPGSAQTTLQKAVEQDPESAPARNALGVALSRAGRWSEAVVEFQNAVRIAPKHAEAQFNLGIALAAQRRHAEAAVAFGAVLGLNPEFADARTGLAAALRAAAASQSEKDGFLHGQDLAANGLLPEALADQAAQLLRNGEFGAAQAALAEALRQRPDFALARFLLGRRFELEGATEAALREYQEGSRLDPENVEFVLRYGSLLAQIEPAAGIAVLARGLENAPAGPATKRDDPGTQAHFALGTAWVRLGNRDRAEFHFGQARARRAQAHAREQALVHLNRGIALLNSGDPREAAATLERSVALAPDVPEALHMLGVARSALHDWPAASESFQAALAVRPADPYILTSYASALYQRGRSEDALNLLEKALRVDPGRSDSLCLLAKVYRQRGDTQTSDRELKRARRVGACSVADEP